MTITKALIKDVTLTLLKRAETTLPGDVKAALKSAYEREEHEIARVQLEAMMVQLEARMVQRGRLHYPRHELEVSDLWLAKV